MNYLDFSENIQSFQKIIDGIHINNVSSAIFHSVQFLGATAILFMIIRSYVLSVTSGGSKPINYFNDIIKPLIIFVIILNWITLMNVIDSTSAYLGDAVKNNANAGKQTQEIVDDFERTKNDLLFYAKMETIRREREDEERGTEFSDIVLPGSDEIQIFLAEKTRELRLIVLNAFASLAMTIQNIVSILFFAYSSIILLILKAVGGIAIILALFPSMQQGFFSWLKNFISVHMWFPIAGLIFYIIDLIYLQTINAMDLNFAHIDMSGITTMFKSVDKGVMHEDIFNKYIGLYRTKIWIFMAFGILKGILMFKVPNIVSMFVGSSSQSGGMFAAAFTPAKMAGSAAGTALKMK